MEGSGSALLSELCAKLATTKVKFAHAEFFEECGGCPASDGALDYAGSDSAAFFVYELSAKRFNIENSGESLSRAHRATKHGPAEHLPRWRSSRPQFRSQTSSGLILLRGAKREGRDFLLPKNDLRCRIRVRQGWEPLAQLLKSKAPPRANK